MTTSNQNVLERIFNLSANGTNVRTELMAGLTTFLAMCYIIIVNPLILGETGMDMGAVFVATCIASAIGCFVMGFVGNYPIALAPGMGLNAYFTYAVVKGMGVPWQVALGAVFVSGIIFILFSFFKVREMLVNALPMGLKMSIAAGIGLFLSLIALKGSGIIVASDATLVKLGDIHQPAALLVLAGFAMVVALGHFRVKGAIILTILTITAISTLLGLSEFKGVIGEIPSIAPTFMQMDFNGLFTLSMVSVIFVFFLVDLFDSTGTLVGVSHRAGLLEDGKLPRLKRALFADSTAIVAGAALGTSSTTPYVESAAGGAAGGPGRSRAFFPRCCPGSASGSTATSWNGGSPGACAPSLCGMAAEYDEQGNYKYPEGFDPEANEWLEGFDAQREAWEAQYAEAQARFEAHKVQVAKALEADAEAAAAAPVAAAEPAPASSYSSDEKSSAGTLASDEALAELRKKLTGN